REKAAIFLIHGQARRTFARPEGPAMEQLDGLRVNLDKFRSVFNIHEDFSCAIRGGKFGAARKLQRAGNGAIGGVDGGGVFAAAVQSEDALGHAIVNDGIWILSCVHRTQRFQRFQVENGDRVRAAVTGEAFAEVGRDRDAVDPLGVLDFTDGSEGIRVEHDDFGAMRNINTACGAIHGDVVPKPITGHGNAFDDLVAGRAGGTSESCPHPAKTHNRDERNARSNSIHPHVNLPSQPSPLSCRLRWQYTSCQPPLARAYWDIVRATQSGPLLASAFLFGTKFLRTG